MTIITHAVIKTRNSKVGPMAATYRTQNSCPTTCPLLGNGCYAAGRIFGQAAKFGRPDLESVLALVDKPLPNGIRFNVSGDFLTAEGEPDMAYIDACNKVAEAHPDALKIAYTHAWRILEPGMFSFVVNASCETLDEVTEAVLAGWQAVMVNGTEGGKVLESPINYGKRVLTCLAEKYDITCAECGLCGSNVRTRPVVSFTAHGSGKNLATKAVEARR